jgi:hypothetical protein
VLTIVGGDAYCVSFGGAAGGTFNPDTATYLRAKNPVTEGACP